MKEKKIGRGEKDWDVRSRIDQRRRKKGKGRWKRRDRRRREGEEEEYNIIYNSICIIVYNNTSHLTSTFKS